MCSSEVSLDFRSSYQGQEACEDALGMEKLVSDRRVVFIEVFSSCASLALHQRGVLRWLCKIRVCILRSIKRVVFHFWFHDQFTSSRDFESREIGKPRARFLQQISHPTCDLGLCVSRPWNLQSVGLVSC